MGGRMASAWATLLLAAALVSSAAQAQPTGNVSGILASQPADPPSACDTVIVGGGPGGVYAAYRLLESTNNSDVASQSTDGAAPRPVCVLEATGRLGGRVYSVRNLGDRQDLTVDMGAYRYNSQRQGIITDIIERLLQLPTRVYDTTMPEYRFITTEANTTAGFTTYVEGLARLALARGASITLDARVLAVNPTPQGFQLSLASGQNVTARRVILNLPSRPLHRLLANSGLGGAPDNPQLRAPYAVTAGKVYLYYPQAWWVAQGLTTGKFTESPVWPPVQFPYSGRFYDGEVRCPLKSSPNGATVDFTPDQASLLDLPSCYGFLQVFYEAEEGPLDVNYPRNASYQPFAYFEDFMASSDPNVPYFVVTNTTQGGAGFLRTAHTRLLGVLPSLGKPVAANTLEIYPTQAVVALWDQAVTWAGGAWHDWKDANYSSVANVASSVQPFPDLQLFLANEAYSVYQHWSEGSLVMAENIVRAHFNASVPAWMRAQTAQAVLFGPQYGEFRGSEER